MSTIGVGLQWLIATLRGDTTLRGYAPGGVHLDVAPVDTATPFIVISFDSGSDTTNANGVRLLTNAVYQVKASGPASQIEAVDNAASRIDDLIGEPKRTPDGLVIHCSRESPVQYGELVGEAKWTNFGGLHRLIIEKS
jgi:hypothetical protein